MTCKIYSHNAGSQGASALASALGVKVLKKETTWRPKAGDWLINWGSSRLPEQLNRARVINLQIPIGIAQDKLRFFQHVANAENPPRVPDWTTDQAVARSWIDGGDRVVARTVLRGHSGVGIHILGGEVDFVAAPLYTKYVPKTAEYRLHFVNGTLIDAQRKIRDPSREPTNWQVRSHDNGFIFVREGVVLPDDVTEQGRRAFLAAGLDFGAVDIIWNEKHGRAYVLEINTAPGLTGQTVTNYANAFKQHFNA